jgi:hypothetical protein
MAIQINFDPSRLAAGSVGYILAIVAETMADIDKHTFIRQLDDFFEQHLFEPK